MAFTDEQKRAYAIEQEAKKMARHAGFFRLSPQGISNMIQELEAKEVLVKRDTSLPRTRIRYLINDLNDDLFYLRLIQERDEQ